MEHIDLLGMQYNLTHQLLNTDQRDIKYRMMSLMNYMCPLDTLHMMLIQSMKKIDPPSIPNMWMNLCLAYTDQQDMIYTMKHRMSCRYQYYNSYMM